MKERASSEASPEKGVICDNIPFSGATLNNLPNVSLSLLRSAATVQRSESARPSGRIAVSERTAYQPDPAIRITDLIGTIEVRPPSEELEISHKDRADWVPEVIRDFGVFVVGTGPVKDSRCGRFRPLAGDSAGACPNQPNKHKPFMVPAGCTRKACFEDWRRWVNKDSRRLENSVNGMLNAKFRNQADLIPGYEPRHLSDHVSIHPPRRLVVELVRRVKRDLPKALANPDNDKYAPEEIFHRLFKQKYEYEESKALAILGVKAPASIYHPVRLKSDIEDYNADAMYDPNRYRTVLDKATWIKHVKFSPHSHIITDGAFLMNSKEFYEASDGWTYRNHREINDVGRLAKYLLSHASAVPGKHSVRYLGDYKRLNLEGTIKVDTFIACPECVKEGMKPEDSTYVIGKLLDVEYGRDKNRHIEITGWSWGEIYERHYLRRTRIIPIFRLPPFGQRRQTVDKDAKGRPVTYERHIWNKLPASVQRVTRWIEHFSNDEWVSLPDDDKPRWWV